MAIVYEGRHPGTFLLSEANFHRSRDNIVVASGAGKLEAGTILAKVTASGKYVAAAATGSDGTQTAVAVLFRGVDATSADVPVAAITRDAEVKGIELVYGTTVNDDTKKLASRTQLAAAGIITRF